MTCVSLGFWWFLMTLGPQPLVLGHFPTRQECQVAQEQFKHVYLLSWPF